MTRLWSWNCTSVLETGEHTALSTTAFPEVWGKQIWTLIHFIHNHTKGLGIFHLNSWHQWRQRWVKNSLKPHQLLNQTMISVGKRLKNEKGSRIEGQKETTRPWEGNCSWRLFSRLQTTVGLVGAAQGQHKARQGWPKTKSSKKKFWKKRENLIFSNEARSRLDLRDKTT